MSDSYEIHLTLMDLDEHTFPYLRVPLVLLFACVDPPSAMEYQGVSNQDIILIRISRIKGHAVQGYQDLRCNTGVLSLDIEKPVRPLSYDANTTPIPSGDGTVS